MLTVDDRLENLQAEVNTLRRLLVDISQRLATAARAGQVLTTDAADSIETHLSHLLPGAVAFIEPEKGGEENGGTDHPA